MDPATMAAIAKVGLGLLKKAKGGDEEEEGGAAPQLATFNFSGRPATSPAVGMSAYMTALRESAAKKAMG